MQMWKNDVAFDKDCICGHFVNRYESFHAWIKHHCCSSPSLHNGRPARKVNLKNTEKKLLSLQSTCRAYLYVFLFAFLFFWNSCVTTLHFYSPCWNVLSLIVILVFFLTLWLVGEDRWCKCTGDCLMSWVSHQHARILQNVCWWLAHDYFKNVHATVVETP